MGEAPFGHDRAAAADDPGDSPGGQRDVWKPDSGVNRKIVDALLGLLDERVAVDLPGQLLGGDVRRDRAVADIGVDLDQEVAADRHRLALGVVDVAGNDGAPAGDLVADELGGDEVGDRRAEVLAVPRFREGMRAAEVLADRDIFHLGRDDAAAGIVHLAHVGAGPGAQHALAGVGEGLDPAAAVRAELAVVLGADLALGDLLDVAAGADPVAAQLGQAGHDVDALRRVGVG